MKRLLEAGLCATVNTDDLAYFGGYLNDKFAQTLLALGLTLVDVMQLVRNSFEVRFVGTNQRLSMIKKSERSIQ